jgi:hypothetical protein
MITFGFTARRRVRGAARRLWLALVLLALALMLAALAVPAQAQGAEGDIPTFDAFLVFLSSTGVAAAAGIVLSWVIEYWPAYEALAPKTKRLAYFGLCLVLPIGAALLRWGLGYVDLTFDPLLWHALWNGAAAGGIGTLFHTRQLPAA